MVRGRTSQSTSQAGREAILASRATRQIRATGSMRRSAGDDTVGPMAESFPLPQAGARLDELVNRARAGAESVILTQDDTPVAAIVGIETLRELQRAQDDADIALCTRIVAGSGPRLTHEAFMALLDDEDAAGA
jgi:prevent-host-death family protein